MLCGTHVVRADGLGHVPSLWFCPWHFLRAGAPGSLGSWPPHFISLGPEDSLWGPCPCVHFTERKQTPERRAPQVTEGDQQPSQGAGQKARRGNGGVQVGDYF